jgi:GntR family transcriptional regulator, transcriptional repressor for pyruvate dehydrogenase complex
VAAREVAGDPRGLAVDANGRFDLPTAVAYGRAMAGLGLRWYEEPGDPLDYRLMSELAEVYDEPLGRMIAAMEANGYSRRELYPHGGHMIATSPSAPASAARRAILASSPRLAAMRRIAGSTRWGSRPARLPASGSRRSRISPRISPRFSRDRGPWKHQVSCFFWSEMARPRKARVATFRRGNYGMPVLVAPLEAAEGGFALAVTSLETDPLDRWHFHPITNPRAHEEVVEQITFAILSGAFGAGERLPNVEALARTMGVSKPVIGEALKVLTKAGVVRAQRGVHGGLSVEKVDVPDSITNLTGPLRHFEVREIIEARRPIELQLALLAGQRATEEDFAAMQVTIDRLREHRHSDLANRIRFDHLFHYTIGRTARSSALALYQHQILENLYVRMRSYFADIEDVDSVIILHEMTLAAVRTRKPEAITEAIDVHLMPLERVVADAAEATRGARRTRRKRK